MNSKLSKIDNLIRKFELQNVVKLKSKYLSGGQVRKLTLAMAMVKDTKILILDEPFAALDPQSVRMIQQIIVSLQMFERISVSTATKTFEKALLYQTLEVLQGSSSL